MTRFVKRLSTIAHAIIGVEIVPKHLDRIFQGQ